MLLGYSFLHHKSTAFTILDYQQTKITHKLAIRMILASSAIVKINAHIKLLIKAIITNATYIVRIDSWSLRRNDTRCRL